MVTLEKKLSDKVSPQEAFSEAVKVSTVQPVRGPQGSNFYSPCKPDVTCSIPGFSSLSDETLTHKVPHTICSRRQFQILLLFQK